MYYILDGHTPVKVKNVMEYHEWYMENAVVHVKLDKLPNGVDVSTVFLGLDHNYYGGGKPILFETMIFGGEHEHFMNRYSTWEEAEAGHQDAINMVFAVEEHESPVIYKSK